MKRKKRSEEEPDDLLGSEPPYYPEGGYPDARQAGELQDKYVPRHSSKKGRAANRKGETGPPPAPRSQAYPGLGAPAPVPGQPPVASGPGAVPPPVVPPEVQPLPSTEAGEVPAAPPQEQYGEGATPGFGYVWVPPPMYPPPYNPQAMGYGGVPPEAGPPPGMGYPYPPPPGMSPFGEPPPPFDRPYGPTGYDEELGFQELALEGESHWRVDFKWIFGILSMILILGTLIVTSFYQISSSGTSKKMLSPMILEVTKLENVINENYTDLRSKARKKKTAVIVIPEIDMDVEVSGEDILSMDKDELAKEVADEIGQMIYAQGYKGDLPMKLAQGAGEERSRAVCVTLLSSLNKGNHENFLIIIIIMGGLSLVFFVLFIVFCRGWGRVVGPGVLLICAALPGSLFMRLGGAFFWNTSQAGLYEGAMYQALLDTASATALFFDIALGVGALLLLIGATGGAISGKRRKRVTPFTTLETTDEYAEG